MLRVQAVNVYPQAIGELLGGVRHAIVADGDPIVPPLHVYVEGPADAERLRAALRTDVAVHTLAPGDLPVAEHKTAHVFRTARGDVLPQVISRHREGP
jgi:hypothetical protein